MIDRLFCWLLGWFTLLHAIPDQTLRNPANCAHLQGKATEQEGKEGDGDADDDEFTKAFKVGLISYHVVNLFAHLIRRGTDFI